MFSLTVGQGLSVEEPLNLHVRVTDWSQLAFELGGLHFNEVSYALDLSHEPRRLTFLAVIDVVLGQEDLLSILLHRGLHLDQVFRLLHTLWNLVLKLNGWKLFALQLTLGNVLSKLIECLADVFTLILRVSVKDI